MQHDGALHCMAARICRVAKTRSVLDALDPATRVAMEGHRPGVYVRICLSGLPCELVQHFDPRNPLLVSACVAEV